MSASDDSQHIADLDLQPNEASGLVAVHDPGLLERRGWDRAFWSCLDEVDVADCVALIGHRTDSGDDDGWEIDRLRVERVGDEGDADDAEAIATRDGWVYLFGSHHGGKEGPLRRSEQWIARFREADVTTDDESRPCAVVTVVNTGFRLHRLVNDALAEGPHTLVAMRDAMRQGFIDDTLSEAEPDVERLVHAGDWTINIEGAEFTEEGSVLLGLRFPVTDDGRPLLVEATGLDKLFDTPRRWPEVTRIWALDAVGRDGDMAGVRDLCRIGDEIHVVTGNLDSKGKGSVVLDDYPGGRDTVNTHFVTRLDPDAPAPLAADVVREFPDRPKIEGVAADAEGQFFYVSDEDEAVHLRCTPLVAAP